LTRQRRRGPTHASHEHGTAALLRRGPASMVRTNSAAVQVVAVRAEEGAWRCRVICCSSADGVMSMVPQVVACTVMPSSSRWHGELFG
jgi:hypothetical protein